MTEGFKMEIRGQRVVITGGTRGIGRELARVFARRGAAVAICGRSDPDRVDLSDVAPTIRYYPCDLTEAVEVEQLARRLRSEFRPTIVVNNAGVQFNHDWTEAGPADRLAWAQVEVAVNLLAPMRLTGLLLDDLLKEEEAAVVNITSVLALAPKRSAPVYCATKAGLRAFSRGIRYQLAAHARVRIVEVLPPVVDTAMTAGRGSGKMDPADVAERIVEGLERDEEEIWVGKARVVRLLARFAPNLVTRILRNA
jgi:uncharacterized oxidoreductase